MKSIRILIVVLVLIVMIVACGGGGGASTTGGTTAGPGKGHVTTDNGPIADAVPFMEADVQKMRLSWFHTNGYPLPFLVINMAAPFTIGTPKQITTPGGTAYASTQGDLGFYASQASSGSITLTARNPDVGTFAVTLYDNFGNPLHITGDFSNTPEDAFGSHGITGKL